MKRLVLVAVGWGWALAIVWLSLTPSPPEVGIESGDKLGHLLAYFFLMLWFCFLYRLPRARLACGLGFIGMGIALELAQGGLGYREMELADMAANAAGVIAAWALAALAPRISAR